MKSFKIILKLLHRVVSYVPLISWILFMAYLIEATIVFGNFPEPDNPDPKFLDKPFFRELVFTSFFFSFVSLLIWPILMFISRKFSLYKLDTFSAKSWVFGILLISIILLGNVFELRTWFVD